MSWEKCSLQRFRQAWRITGKQIKSQSDLGRKNLEFWCIYLFRCSSRCPPQAFFAAFNQTFVATNFIRRPKARASWTFSRLRCLKSVTTWIERAIWPNTKEASTRVTRCLGPLCHVLSVATVEVSHGAISLKGYDVGAYPVQEPPVVRYDHYAASKVRDSIFKVAEHIHVKVICRLVQHNDVAPSFKHLQQSLAIGAHKNNLYHLSEVYSVTLPSREYFYRFFLSRPSKVELWHMLALASKVTPKGTHRSYIASCRHLAVTHVYLFLPVWDLFIYGVPLSKLRASLTHKAQLHLSQVLTEPREKVRNTHCGSYSYLAAILCFRPSNDI